MLSIFSRMTRLDSGLSTKGRDLDRIQGWLTARSEGAQFDDWKESLSPGDRARVTSASQKFASK